MQKLTTHISRSAVSFLLLCQVLLLPLLGSTSCSRERHYRIGVSQCSLDDWRDKLNDEIRRELIFHPEADVEILSAGDDVETQKAQIRKLIDSGVDILIVSPIEAKSMTSVIKEAYDKGIPVVTFDRQIEGDSYTAHIGADNRLIGTQAGEYVAKRLGFHGKVAEICGLAGSTPSEERHEGFAEEIGRHPDLTLAATAYGDWTSGSGARIADSLLTVHPDLDALVVQNDRMALAAREAARRHGRGDILITGVDAVEASGIKGVADGDIDVTFLYPTGGYEIVRTALKILRGEPCERETILASATPVDSGNVRMVQLQEAALRDNTEKITTLKSTLDRYATAQHIQRALIAVIVAALLLSAIFIFMLLRSYWQRRRDEEALERQNDLLREQKAVVESQRDRMAELNEKLNSATAAKLTFFTNVSHDLRTPLTLIAEPLRRLLEATGLTAEERELAAIADKNVKILMRLINQVLDFRKFENGKLNLMLEEAPVGTLFEEWSASFRPVAVRRHLRLEVSNLIPEGFTCAIDVEKTERIFFNLMSNAIRYTPDNGKVGAGMMLWEDGSVLLLKVTDTGRGMNAEEAGRVFERFYQTDDRIIPGGSGIGLAVAKAFANLHDGDITVVSREGEGSEFTLSIPVVHVDKKAGKSDPAIGEAQIGAELWKLEEELMPADDNPEGKPTVLVIDDNADIIAMVRLMLKEEYTVLEAPDGRQGIRMALKYLPDAIVCDIMMPGMDGFECCRRLKEEPATSHIPVLLLTACARDEQRLEGYTSGADGYLTKPFSSDMLRAVLQSLLLNRRRITVAFTSQDGMAMAQERREAAERPDATKAVAGDLDTAFYRQFIDVVEADMGNSNLSTEMVGERMGMSRTQLYRKLKTLTNYSPNELIRNMRLSRARQLLQSTEDTVSEVAYKVGFNSPSYFSRCFRERYGELPAELQKRTSKPGS